MRTIPIDVPLAFEIIDHATRNDPAMAGARKYTYTRNILTNPSNSSVIARFVIVAYGLFL